MEFILGLFQGVNSLIYLYVTVVIIVGVLAFKDSK